jgi:metallophosphoesterase superfamily enzyme
MLLCTDHPFLVHGASKNRNPKPRKVIFTHYFPALGAAEAAQRKRELTWLTGDDNSSLEERFHPEHLAARRGDVHFHRLISPRGWSAHE